MLRRSVSWRKLDSRAYPGLAGEGWKIAGCRPSCGPEEPGTEVWSLNVAGVCRTMVGSTRLYGSTRLCGLATAATALPSGAAPDSAAVLTCTTLTSASTAEPVRKIPNKPTTVGRTTGSREGCLHHLSSAASQGGAGKPGILQVPQPGVLGLERHSKIPVSCADAEGRGMSPLHSKA